MKIVFIKANYWVLKWIFFGQRFVCTFRIFTVALRFTELVLKALVIKDFTREIMKMKFVCLFTHKF